MLFVVVTETTQILVKLRRPRAKNDSGYVLRKTLRIRHQVHRTHWQHADTLEQHMHALWGKRLSANRDRQTNPPGIPW